MHVTQNLYLLHKCTFSLLGPIPWLIVAEMFDTKYVATAMSISSIVNWLGNFAVGLGFPFMSVYLGSWSFGPFIITLLIIFVFSHFFLIETLGKSVEEVNRLAMGEDDEDDSDNDQEANTAKNTSANTNLQPMEVSSKK